MMAPIMAVWQRLLNNFNKNPAKYVSDRDKTVAPFDT